MDAIQFLKERKRMCDNMNTCEECPFKVDSGKRGCHTYMETFPEKAISEVEKWSQENQIRNLSTDYEKEYRSSARVNFNIYRQNELNFYLKNVCKKEEE